MTTISITLDHVDGISLQDESATRFHNQLQLLSAWQHGLHFLYAQMLLTESFYPRAMAAEFAEQARPPAVPAALCFDNLGCCFQWYAVTFCNYTELVASIAWAIGTTEETVQKYRKRVSGEILPYRNLVAAHVAEAHGTDATPAEKFASLIPPTAFHNRDGRSRFYACEWTAMVGTSGNQSNSSRLQSWSLTAMHEKHASRFWPGVPESIRARLNLDSQSSRAPDGQSR